MKRNNRLIIGGLVLCASAFVIFSGKGTEKQEVNAITVERTGRVANMAKPVVVNETINSTGKEVSSQLELRNALNDSSLSSIIIHNDNGEEFNIPSGDYSKVSLVVNAPNSDITNQGLFKDITINAIASDTWIEKVNGNILILNAAAGHIVVPNDVEVTEIRIVNKTVDSQFVLDIAGEVSKITIESTSDVKLNVSGKVGDIEINERASLVIEGTSTDNINITISEDADGTMITSGVELNVESASDADIVLKKGAEGSKVAILDETKVVEVTNNTTEKVIVKTFDDNNVVEIDPKRNGIINAQGQVVGTTTGGVTGVDGITPPATHVIPPVPSSGDSGIGNSGSSDSGSGNSGSGDSGLGDAQSSGNLTRIITRFETIPSICAGTVGETLLPISSLNLPTSVIGIAVNGERISFPIISWENTNNYSTSSKAGNYSFTGKVGIPSGNIQYSINSGIVPVCRVYVKAIAEIEYYDDYAKDISINVYESPDGNEEYFECTNTKQENVSVYAQCYYYDENGYKIPDKSSTVCDFTLYKGDTLVSEAHSKARDFEYTSRKIVVRAYRYPYEKEDNVLNDISFTYDKKASGLDVKIKNNSSKIIYYVYVSCLFFDENGKALGFGRGYTNKVYAPGYEDTITIEYPSRAVPASYLAFTSGANVLGDPDSNSEENDTEIEYYDDYAKDISINVYESPDGNEEYFECTNTKQENVSVYAQCYYYDENGYKIPDKSSTVCDFTLYKGDTLVSEAHSKARDFEYTSRKIVVRAYRYPYEKEDNVLNDISFTYDKKASGLDVKIKNNSSKIIYYVYVSCLFFDENGKALGFGRGYTNKVYAPGYEDTITIEYPSRAVPASYLAFTSGANVLEDPDSNRGSDDQSAEDETSRMDLPTSGEWTYQGITFNAQQVAYFHAMWDYTGDAAEMASHHSASELLQVCKFANIPGDNYPEASESGDGESETWVGPWEYQGVTFNVQQVAHFHALWDYTGDAKEMAMHHSAEELLTVCRIEGIQ